LGAVDRLLAADVILDGLRPVPAGEGDGQGRRA
jgi:hypothetical protein